MHLTIYKHLVIDRDRPLVFLDMDGVLNGGYQHEHYDTFYRDEVLIRPSFPGDYVLDYKAKPLMRALKEHRAQVVLVSSWFRPMIDGDHPQVEEFRSMFDITPLGSLETQGGVGRGRAVAECLGYTKHPHWVVIDDCGHFYSDERFTPDRVVSPSGRYGLQAADMEKLTVLLSH